MYMCSCMWLYNIIINITLQYLESFNCGQMNHVELNY